jgi:hypothetical protein
MKENLDRHQLELCCKMFDVTDRPLKCRGKVTFNDKAKVGALIQRAHAFKKQKLADEANEELQREQQALARAVSTCQYAVSQDKQGPCDCNT